MNLTMENETGVFGGPAIQKGLRRHPYMPFLNVMDPPSNSWMIVYSQYATS